ncbi:MAG: hypothetical protein JPMHGGIA_00646 [Saprospiraceae bacterium]|nr:hypothetical protein [Saprospiraceae bacterium]
MLGAHAVPNLRFWLSLLVKDNPLLVFHFLSTTELQYSYWKNQLVHTPLFRPNLVLFILECC